MSGHGVKRSASPLNGFTHVLGTNDYAALFYAYPWAEMLAADVMAKLKAHGSLRAGGAALRHEILARGDAEDPSLLVRRFLGREPSTEALLAQLGVSSRGGAAA